MTNIDEVYCRGIRAAGAHGTWQPGSRAWPGDYGQYDRGIFKRLGSLSSRGYTYGIEPDVEATVIITSERVTRQAFSAAGQASDPIEVLAEANGKVSLEFSNENEVALLTAPGSWYSVVDVEGLLAQVQNRIERWPTRRLIVCSVFQTDKGVAVVSSGENQAVEIGVGASAAVHGAAKAGGDAGFSARWSRATGWVSPFSSPADLSADPFEPRSRKSTPLFGNCYRVRRKYWDRFGPRRIEEIDGNVIVVDVVLVGGDEAAGEVEDAEAMADLKSLNVFELFELLEPQTVNDELDEERGVVVAEETPLLR